MQTNGVFPIRKDRAEESVWQFAGQSRHALFWENGKLRMNLPQESLFAPLSFITFLFPQQISR